MTNRERMQAIMHYEKYDRIPVVSFGFWTQTLRKWRDEGHISPEKVYDRPMADLEYDEINKMLGFDFNWHSLYGISQYLLDPLFEQDVLEEYPDGKQKMLDVEGNIILTRPGEASIPSEIGHTLVNRESWETYYLPRLSYGAEKLDQELFGSLKKDNDTRENPRGLFCGSMLGRVRNWLGLENLTYMWYDEPELFTDIVNTVGELMYRQTKNILELGVKFDYSHFWEDICGNDGPLVGLDVLRELAGPHYRRISELLKQHGIDIVSVDCDGCIDHMVPIWLENGLNTMFPIEIGYWNASITPWREQYGKNLRGVGGVDKRIFGMDYAAIDKEIERIKPMIAAGGYIPCPDHRIPPDAKWENVQYYCDKMRLLK